MTVEPAVQDEPSGSRRARDQEEAVRTWLRRVAPLLLVVVVATAWRTTPRPGLTGRGLVVSLGLVGFVLGVLMLRKALMRWGGTQIIVFVVLVASSGVLMWAQPHGPGPVGVLLAFVFVARVMRGRLGAVLAVAAFVVVASIEWVSGQGGDIWLLAFVGGFYGMVFLAYRLAQANQHAEQLLADLRHSREAEARAAGLAERQRLAREMHDVLAHSLSGLMLQLEGARMLAASNPLDSRLPEAIDRAHHLAKSGLEEARRAIGMLRDDELPGPERLAALIEEFEADRGIPCHLTVAGEERPLGAEARLAIYRVAQEALTNIAKHAQPTRVELQLEYQLAATRLTIEDFTADAAATPTGTADSGGYGLTGMRERAELLGGSLITEATASGFRVALDVPA